MPIYGKVNKYTSRYAGFSLVELLVAVAIFAIMAAIAWSALNSIAQNRAEIARDEDDLHSLMQTIGMLQRDLRQAVARPVLSNYGAPIAGFIGAADKLEFTQLGFANPQAELRSNLERVIYGLGAGGLVRGTYPVLDRAPGTQASLRVLRRQVTSFRLRYLDAQQHWVGAWPETGASPVDGGNTILPRAVEVHLDTPDYGEIVCVVELVSDFHATAAGAVGALP